MGLVDDGFVSKGAELYLAQGMDAPTKVADALPNPGSGDRPEHWYALYTCPRHEKRVAEQMEERRISCFLPLYRSVRRWKDRRKKLELALFPGYLFVRIALRDKLQVLKVPGAVRLVTVNGQPAALPDLEIECLRNRQSMTGTIEPHPYLCVGRRVRVRSGPLQGLEGIIRRRKDKCRVVFSIALLMRSVAVEVDEADLELVG